MLTFGNYEVCDPVVLHTYCLDQTPPLPTDWLGRVNYFQNALGEKPGAGSILLTRANFNALNPNTAYDLVLSDESAKATIKNLNFQSARCLTPGARNDANSVFIVHLTDRRRLLEQIPINTAYNLRKPDGTDFWSGTKNGGTAWTWQEIVQNLATALGLGTQTLPYTPHGTPEEFSFYADYAWRALNIVLNRLGCAIAWNPFTDTPSIVEVGKTDAAIDAAILALDTVRLWDSEPRPEPTKTNIPEKVRVRFTLYPAPTDGTTPYYLVDVSAPSSFTGTTVSGSMQILVDDLAKTTANAAACATRADERRDKYYQALLGGALTDPLHRVFSGVQSSTNVLPGQRVKSWWIGDIGNGLKTEIVRVLNVAPSLGELLTSPVLTPAGTLIVQDTEPTVVNGVVTLTFDYATGLNVATTADPTEAKVFGLAASVTQQGMVTTGVQSFAGIKQFTGASVGFSGDVGIAGYLTVTGSHLNVSGYADIAGNLTVTAGNLLVQSPGTITTGSGVITSGGGFADGTGGPGVSGNWTTVDGKTITSYRGIITSIV